MNTCTGCLRPKSSRAINDRQGNRIAIPKLSCPTLVIGAEYDARQRFGRDDELVANYHGGDFYLARDHGHDLCIEEGSEVVLEVVRDWLRRCENVG